MSQPKFLLIGIGANHPSVPEAVKEKAALELRETLPKAAKDAGINLNIYFLSQEDAINNYKNALTSRPDIAAVVIGWGVRANPQLNDLFEQIVNATIEVAPKAKLLFNTNIMSTIDAIKRYNP